MVICEQLSTPITEGSTVEKSLKQIQKTDKLQKAYKKTPKSKKAKAEKRKCLFAMYETQQDETDYQKKQTFA